MNFKLDKISLLLYRRKSHKSLTIKEFRREARPKSLVLNELGKPCTSTAPTSCQEKYATFLLHNLTARGRWLK